MTNVEVRDLSRRYADFVALDQVSFNVERGEFLTLLGPSGCGKSTTLAALAGLDRPTSGTIRVGERVLFDGAAGIFVDAQFRNIGLMFQSYALWPHMTVRQNLDFPLELRRVRGEEARRRIDEALAIVDMDAFADRYPGELSGGQQQRVALARTLVYRPEILLLDEPLSNLDAKLREKARLWLGDLQKKTGVTTVYVTHDQTEALSLSDRIIVMNKGRIAQIGTPTSIYENPADAFVADFVGSSNLVQAKLGQSSTGGRMALLPTGNALQIPADSIPSGTEAILLRIRPEKLQIVDAVSGENVLQLSVDTISYLGARNLIVARIGDQSIRIETEKKIETNTIAVKVPVEAIRVFPDTKA